MAYKKRTDKKRQTLQKGEFVRASDGRYCFKYKDPYSGKFKIVYADTLKDLREKEEGIKKDLDRGINISSAQTTTLNDLFYYSLEMKEKDKTLRPQTRHNYEIMWEYNIADFGQAKVAEVDAKQVHGVIAEMVAQGKSKSTIKLLYYLLSQVFEDACSQNLRLDNPCKTKEVKRAKANGAKAQKKEALTPDEQTELEWFVSQPGVYNAYRELLMIALYTGMRVGELTGLIWSDFDMKAGTITVQRQMRYGKRHKGDKTHFYIEIPKTDAGIRIIYFGEEVREAVTSLKRINFALGKTQKETAVDGVSGFIFLNRNGSPYNTASINFILNNIVARHNLLYPDNPLPHISAHILRHCYATRAVENGTDYKTLQKRLGHTDIGVTMNTYVSTNDEEFERKEALKISKMR